MNWQELPSDGRNGVVFVDTSVEDWEIIMGGIKDKAIFLLDGDGNGVERITEVLQKYSNLDNIEIISHGNDGFLKLGAQSLNSGEIEQYAGDLQIWGESLNAGGDLLVYGCNFAATEMGQTTLDRLAKLTGADVAASNDLTGSNDLGGDWELEVKLGSIETTTIEVREYDGVFEFYNGKEYRLTDRNLSWERAQQEAESAGGNLVTINNAAEQAWLRQTFGDREDFWIGINDRRVEGQFEWVNGETVTYTNWAEGQPNNSYGIQDYGAMNYEGEDGWNDNFSFNRFRGIIEIDVPDNPIFTYNGNQYQLTSGSVNWDAAQAEAVGKGGNLVTINDVAEETWLKETFGTDRRFWLGLNDRDSEGQFEWVSGDPVTYTNWTPNEPNNAGGNQDFAVMNFSGSKQWDDEFGDRAFQGIIEIPDPDLPSSISLEQNTYSINEANGNLEIAVLRSGNTQGEATIEYRVDSGTAIESVDFAATSGTLNFAAGDDRRVITVPIINDEIQESAENFTVVIQSPTGADLGTIRTATATIVDDDRSSLSFNSPRVEEGTDSVTVNLIRGNSSLDASVDFITVDGTAVAGDDYETTSGTVTFAAGEIAKTITIPIADDNIGEPKETFSVQFSNPSNIFLDNGDRTTVTIDDNDGGNFVREDYITGLNLPTAFARTPDDSLMFISEKSGLIKVAQGNNLLATPFIDLRDEVNDVRDRGLLSVAVHPDFFNGSPYVYATYTYDPPEAYQNINPNTNLDDPDNEGNRPSRIVRITADAATNYTTAVAGSKTVIVGKNSTWANTSRPDANSTKDQSIPESGRTPDGGYVQDYLKTDSESHSIGHIAFGEDGMLYISVGDGTSYNRVDDRTVSVLTPDSLSGKILRVDPITGEGLSDNPFYDGDPNSNRSKVWNLALRNPFRFSIQPSTGIPFIGDVGWKTWEEVNVGTRGANFGWAAYEGGVDANGNTINLPQPEYDAADIPEIEAFYQSGQTVTAPIYARNHADGAKAIVLGDFYEGTSFPSIYQGALFVADVNEGTVDALILNGQNRVTEVRRFASGIKGIVYMESGSDDNLYYVNINEGTIGRWRSV
jgi:glucose/arabinose dehydrogenase/HAMP domain-containing protein